MDPAAIVSLASPLITALVTYIKDEGAKQARDKAAEVIGEKTGEALAEVGPRALSMIRSWFQRKNDRKAQQALELVEQDPDDTDYQEKLLKETTRLAAADPAFAQDLQVLAQQVTIAQPNSIVGTVHNLGTNEGVQGGVISGSITLNSNK